MPEESWEDGIGVEIGIEGVSQWSLGTGRVIRRWDRDRGRDRDRGAPPNAVILNEVKNLGARYIGDKRYEYQSAERFLDSSS